MFDSAVRVPDPTTEADFGNGFLLRHGYTVAWVGWQHEVPRQARAHGDDGADRAWTHGSRALRMVPQHAGWTQLPLADRYHVSQPTVDVADPSARLLVRASAVAAYARGPPGDVAVQ